MRSLIFVALLALPLSGCSIFSYELTPPTTVTPDGPIYIGKDCGATVFGFGWGNLRAGDAMLDGGVTQPTKIILEQHAVMIFGWNCVTVEGTGPGPDPSRSVTPTSPGYRRR